MGDGDQTVDERRRERLHALHGDTLRDLLEDAREARELVLHLSGPLPDGRAELRQAGARADLVNLRGILHRPGRTPVSLRGMQEAIEEVDG